MASTPPAQIRAEAHTPPTPLHGSAYHSKSSPSRYNTRSNTKKTPGSVQSSFTQSPDSSRTPRSPGHDPFHSVSQTTPKRKSTHLVQVISPTSPDAETPAQNVPHQHNPSHLSAATIMPAGMLPSPVKTPQKNRLAKPTMAARALFQDHPSAILQSPRKNPKRRHNGFSLESFSEDASFQDPIQIHVDSRDQLPEVDASTDNPFYTAPSSESKKRAAPPRQKMAGASKRRKVSTEQEKRPLDPQVEEAIDKDEGMVYVFRGKKVYRRFDDAGEEEEVIDPEELGLLEREANGHEIVRPLKTLTRKSIRPRRLFQDETSAQPLPSHQASQSDEEAETEIEDNQATEELEQPSPSRATRSRTRDVSNNGGAKKVSPFDAWPRLKSGARSGSSMPASKGRKRTAAEALDV